MGSHEHACPRRSRPANLPTCRRWRSQTSGSPGHTQNVTAQSSCTQASAMPLSAVNVCSIRRGVFPIAAVKLAAWLCRYVDKTESALQSPGQTQSSYQQHPCNTHRRKKATENCSDAVRAPATSNETTSLAMVYYTGKATKAWQSHKGLATPRNAETQQMKEATINENGRQSAPLPEQTLDSTANLPTCQ